MNSSRFRKQEVLLKVKLCTQEVAVCIVFHLFTSTIIIKLRNLQKQNEPSSLKSFLLFNTSRKHKTAYHKTILGNGFENMFPYLN